MRVVLVCAAVALSFAAVILYGRDIATPPVESQVRPSGVVWGGRVFATREELGRWLARRGHDYATWARRHPEAARRLSS